MPRTCFFLNVFLMLVTLPSNAMMAMSLPSKCKFAVGSLKLVFSPRGLQVQFSAIAPKGYLFWLFSNCQYDRESWLLPAASLGDGSVLRMRPLDWTRAIHDD